MTNKTAVLKIFTDFSMFVCFLFLFAYPASGGFAHEVSGLLLTALFLLHNILNFRWYKALFRGEYNAARILWTAVNFGLLTMFLICVFSGAAVSRFLFKPLAAGGFYAHKLHVCSAHWVLFFAAAHSALHFGPINGAIAKLPAVSARFMRGAFFCFALYGLKVFFAEAVFAKLAFYYTFSFGGAGRGLAYFCLEYFALFCFYAAFARTAFFFCKIKE